MPKNRGKALEKTILELFKRYEQLGFHCQQNHPEMIQGGKFVRNHGFDFQVFAKGQFYAFDAKNCKGETFSITTNCKKHQIKALFDVKRQGGEGFFLVYFEGRGLNKLDVDEVIELLEKGVKSIEYNNGRKVGLDFLGEFKNGKQISK